MIRLRITWQKLTQINVVFFSRHRLDMSGGRLKNRASSCDSSTPVKAGQKQTFHTDNDVLSDDEERFSLLSPIYSGSSNSDEELDLSEPQNSSSVRSNRSSVSPVRCMDACSHLSKRRILLEHIL